MYKSSTAKNQDQLQENIKQDNQSISNNASSEQQEMPQALLQYTDGGVILGLSLVHEFSKIQHRISLTFDDMDRHQHMTYFLLKIFLKMQVFEANWIECSIEQNMSPPG